MRTDLFIFRLVRLDTRQVLTVVTLHEAFSISDEFRQMSSARFNAVEVADIEWVDEDLIMDDIVIKGDVFQPFCNKVSRVFGMSPSITEYSQ